MKYKRHRSPASKARYNKYMREYYASHKLYEAKKARDAQRILTEVSYKGLAQYEEQLKERYGYLALDSMLQKLIALWHSGQRSPRDSGQASITAMVQRLIQSWRVAP